MVDEKGNFVASKQKLIKYGGKMIFPSVEGRKSVFQLRFIILTYLP